MKLPPGQQRVLTFFADAEDQGRQASRAEVAEALGYAFPSAVTKHVDALVRKGLMDCDREKMRNVTLSEAGWAALQRTPAHLGVPIVGSIAAGTPILASENHNGFIDDVTPAPGRLALEVRGDSMIDAGINDGDFAIIDSGQDIPNGFIGAVVVDGEATLKRVEFVADRLILHPENKHYQPIIVSRHSVGGETCSMVGPLRFIYRAF
jgi:repressor LexA